MSTTPTGILSTPLAALRELVAGSSAFQAWTGLAGTAALERVHLLVAPEDAVRPFCLIDFGDFARERQAVTNRRSWVQRQGSTMLVWFQADANGADEPDASLDFCNTLGAVIADMEVMAGQYESETFAASLFELVVPPIRTPEERWSTDGDYFESCVATSYTRQP